MVKLKGAFLMLVFLNSLMVTVTVNAQVNVQPDAEESVETRYKFFYAEGLRHKLLGETNEAMISFQKCVELKPGAPAPFYELGLLNFSKKDFISAEGYAQNAWKRDKENEWYGILLIESFMGQGKYEACAKTYGELQKSFPENLEFITGEIEMLQNAGLFREALSRLKKSGRHDELDRWKVIKEKDLLSALNQWDKGAAVMEKWLVKNPEDLEIRGILAETYAARGEKVKAQEHYVYLKQLNPDNPAVSFSYGQFLFKNGKKEEAIDEFVRGFKSTDVNPLLKIEIVREFIMDQESQDKFEPDVVKLIENLYNSDKGIPEVDALYANYLYGADRMAEAEPLYHKITQTDPGNYVVWQNLLFILNEKEDYQKMWSVSDSALQYFPGQSLFYLFKGISAIGKKDYESAVTVLQKGLSVPGQVPEITKQFYISLAEASYRTGRKDEAYRYFDQMLVLDPDNVLVLNNYSYYLSLEEQDLDKALSMIEKCIEVEKENPTYLDTYAWVLFKRGEYAQALDEMEKVMRLTDKHSGEVLEHYGDILYKNGMTEKAIEVWKEARNKGETYGDIDSKIRNGLK